MKEVSVTRWPEDHSPIPEELEGQLEREGLSFYRWSNGPSYRYMSHRHGYHKVIIVQFGTISFGLPEEGEEVELRPGDRLELPAGTTHDAVVGPTGVVCLEAHR